MKYKLPTFSLGRAFIFVVMTLTFSHLQEKHTFMSNMSIVNDCASQFPQGHLRAKGPWAMARLARSLIHPCGPQGAHGALPEGGGPGVGLGAVAQGWGGVAR